MHSVIYPLSGVLLPTLGFPQSKLIDYDEIAGQGARVGSCPYHPLPRGARAHQIFGVLIGLILEKKTEHKKMLLSRNSPRLS